jgi:hypothetical protein
MTLALTALNTIFQQYFDGVATVGQETELSLIPVKSISPGIGSYIGAHTDPSGDITALRIDTIASVRLEAGNADMSSLTQGLTSSVLGVDRSDLQQAGIYQLKMKEMEPIQAETGNRSSRIVHFSLLYEYLVMPTESVSLIEDIILDIDLNVANGDADVLVNTGFDAQWSQLFDVVDDPDAGQNTPSNWQFDPVEVAIHQTSGIRGGSLGLTRRKSGTYLLLKSSAATPPVKDLLVDVDFTSLDNDGVGFVFRYQDTDNFYFCVLSARNDYAMLGKKVGGNFSFLDEGGQANIIPYQTATLHRLKLVVLGNQFRVYVDDNPLVSGSDEDFGGVGQVGVMCHGNDDVFFHRLQLLKLLSR